jgi:small subunit ribosomal protein S20
MPHTRSAKKNLRKSEKRRLANRACKKAIKKQIKAFLAALEGPLDEARKQFALTAKKLDKAGAKRVIHPNLADRKKSQLALQLHAREKGAAPKA